MFNSSILLALDKEFDPEEHYDFLNIQTTRCYEYVIDYLQYDNDAVNSKGLIINNTTPNAQMIASSLTDDCEKDSVKFVSLLNTPLDRFNLLISISSPEWSRHFIYKIPSVKYDHSYPAMCQIFPQIIKNGSIVNGTTLFSNPVLGLYGKLFHNGTLEKYISYTHPLIVMAKVKHAISAGFGGVLISNILEDDFNNECGNGHLPMMNAIFQSIETINESEKTEKERQKGKERQSKASLKKSEERDSFDSFMERGGVVLKLCFALLLLGAVSHAIYWPIYFFQNKNRVVRGKTPSRNNN